MALSRVDSYRTAKPVVVTDVRRCGPIQRASGHSPNADLRARRAVAVVVMREASRRCVRALK